MESLARRARDLGLAALFAASSGAGCLPRRITPIEDIPKLAALTDVMDEQAASFDPVFARRSKDGFDDADFASFATAGVRIAVTSRHSHDFADGRPEFEVFASKLNEEAKGLFVAAVAKDADAVKASLADMKATCRGCHARFR